MRAGLRPRIDLVAIAHWKRLALPRVRLRPAGGPISGSSLLANAALWRVRPVERLALPLAVVVVAGVSGTAIALLIHPDAPGGVALSKIAASIRGAVAPAEPSRVVQARKVAARPSPERATDLPQAAPSPGSALASQIGMAQASDRDQRDNIVKAGDGTTDSDPPAAENGAPETPVSQNPSNPAVEPGDEEPAPEEPPAPASALPFDVLESTLGQLGVNPTMIDPETLLATVAVDMGAESTP